MAEENTAKSSGSEKAAKQPPKAAGAAKAKKKEKPPAIEDKPFPEFIEQHFIPDLAKALQEEGLDDVSLQFEKNALEVKGATASEDYWQVRGQWPAGSDRHFSIVFTEEDIKAPKFFCCGQGSSLSSTVEQFMGDERRINLDLMVLYTLQRLNGQKWLTRN